MTLAPPRPSNAPLNALRALEAAGRHGSFLRAAEELSVTPGAVAQQIKKLEDWAGAKLFERHRHGVVLTTLGHRLMPQLEQGFEALGLVAQSLRHAAERPEIRIAALPAIAQLWLGPRLSDLKATLGEVTLAVHALDSPPMLGRGDFDVAIYPGAMGSGPVRGQVVLEENALMPVASPTVAVDIRTPEDLAHTVLMHDLAWKQDWQHWLEAQDIHGIPTERGPSHSLYSMAVDRCIAGDGVLIGHTALVRHQLQSGTLIPVFAGREVPWHPICLHRAVTNSEQAQVAAIEAALVKASA